MMARNFASYMLNLRKRETGDLIDNRKASLRKYLLTVETRRIGNEEGTSRGKERSARVSRRGGDRNGRVKGNRGGGKERESEREWDRGIRKEELSRIEVSETPRRGALGKSNTNERRNEQTNQARRSTVRGGKMKVDTARRKGRGNDRRRAREAVPE